MGIGVSELLLILAIAVVVFGTKKLKNIGTDLGGAIKGFREAVKEGEQLPVQNNSQSSVELKSSTESKSD
jgi:sec-independent protein translocase protein TatA